VDQYNDKARGIASATRVHHRPVRRILPGGKQFRSEPLRPPQRSRDHNGWLKPKRHLLCACVRVKGGCRRLVEATPDTKKSTTDTCHDFCSYAHAHARTGRHCTLVVGSSRRMRMHVCSQRRRCSQHAADLPVRCRCRKKQVTCMRHSRRLLFHPSKNVGDRSSQVTRYQTSSSKNTRRPP
jgi:hypothetical protein